MTGRDKFIVVALIGLLVVVSGGAVVADRSDTMAIPAFGGTYVEGVVGEVVYLDPVIAATNVDLDVVRLVFSGLTRYDRDGSIVADLAAAFHSDLDGKRWTFDIRPDALWQDGHDVTADDVLYTVSLLQDKAYVGPYSDAFRGVTIERLGRKTVRFTLPDAFGPFAASTTVPLLPAHLLAGVAYGDLPQQPFNQRPVGTGPFRVQRVESGQITLARSDDFYRTKPARSRAFLDRVILRAYPDTGEALAALARGEIDGVAGLASAEAARARSLKNVVLYSLPTNDFAALFLNLRPGKAVFRDRAVRQAIATAIDRGRVLQVAADGRGAVADEFVPPTSWAFVRDVRKYAYSVEDATALLEDADWKDHDGDGIRDKGGVALAFSITTSDEPQRVAAAAQISEDLRAIGMKVDVKTVTFGELVARVAPQRSFDALLVGIAVTGDPDPYSFFHSSQAVDPGHNFSGYSTLPNDRNLEAARRATDPQQRHDLYAPVFQAIATDVPVVYLYFSDYLYAQQRTVQGLRIAPISDDTQRFWNVEDWYIRTAPRR